jgi:hypothetical protein
MIIDAASKRIVLSRVDAFHDRPGHGQHDLSPQRREIQGTLEEVLIPLDEAAARIRGERLEELVQRYGIETF